MNNMVLNKLLNKYINNHVKIFCASPPVIIFFLSIQISTTHAISALLQLYTLVQFSFCDSLAAVRKNAAATQNICLVHILSCFRVK